MPKLRPINLQLLKAGDKEESIRVIKDLLILTPRGKNQNLRAADYIKVDDHPGKDAYIRGTLDENGYYYNRDYKAEEYGYSSDYIYYAMKNLGATGTHIGEWDCREAVTAVTGTYRGAKMTRGCRRLARRAAHAWKDAITSGVLGDMTWECSVETPRINKPHDRYGGHQQRADIRFAAKTKQEAEVMLATMFSHAVDNVNGSRFTAWKVAEPAVVMSKNLEEVETLRQRRVRIQEEIVRLQQHMANIETLEEAITMYSATALGEDN